MFFTLLILATGFMSGRAPGDQRSTTMGVRQATNVASDSTEWEWREVIGEEAKQTNFEIKSCDFLTAEEGWAVGAEDSILHWDGAEWSRVPPPPNILDGEPLPYSSNLYDVQILSKDTVWIVGEVGRFAKWDGNIWNEGRFDPPWGDEPERISFSSENLGFAVGGLNTFGQTTFRTIHRWDGKTWTPQPFPSPGYYEKDFPALRAIQMVSDRDGWVAGRGLLYRWDGVRWSVYTQEGEDWKYVVINDFSLLQDGTIWAVGYVGDDEKIIQWNKNQWNIIQKVENYIPTRIRMVAPDLGWAIGYRINAEENKDLPESILLTWDGVQWSSYPLSDPGLPSGTSIMLRTICAYDREHAWIFGFDQEEPITLRYQKRPVDTPTPTVTITPSPTPTVTSSPTVTVTITPIPSPVQAGTDKARDGQLHSILPYVGAVVLIGVGVWLVFLLRKTAVKR